MFAKAFAHNVSTERTPRRSWSGDQDAELDRSHLDYDAWNRLVVVHTDDGYGAPDKPLAEYEYDGLNRRIEAKVQQSDPADSSLDETRHVYYSDRWQRIEVRVDGTAKADIERQYFWGQRYVDDLFMRRHDANGDGDFADADEEHYALHDVQFSVTALIDDSGAVDERYRYEPYGKRTVLNADFTEHSATRILVLHSPLGRIRRGAIPGRAKARGRPQVQPTDRAPAGSGPILIDRPGRQATPGLTGNVRRDHAR